MRLRWHSICLNVFQEEKMKRLSLVLVLLVAAGLMPLSSQSVNFKAGVFIPSMESELWDINLSNLNFSKADMVDVYYTAEYEQFINRFLAVGLEGGIYKQEIFSAYRDFVFEDDTPIEQNLSLRITSLELNIRLYPMGIRKTVYPYISAGPGIYFWKYEQWGYFIDSIDGTVDQGFADSSRVALGFNARAGLVARIGKTTGVSFEAKYLYLKDNLSDLFQDFDKLDMNGLSFNFGIHFFIW